MSAPFVHAGDEGFGRKKQPVAFFVRIGPGFEFTDKLGIGVVDYNAVDAAFEGMLIVAGVAGVRDMICVELQLIAQEVDGIVFGYA